MRFFWWWWWWRLCNGSGSAKEKYCSLIWDERKNIVECLVDSIDNFNQINFSITTYSSPLSLSTFLAWLQPFSIIALLSRSQRAP